MIFRVVLAVLSLFLLHFHGCDGDQWALPQLNPLTKLRSDLRIYIYSGVEWDGIATASMSARIEDELLESGTNSGAGPALNVTSGSYHTDQYQLYALMYHRLLKDPRRTFNPAEATTFFVPYDLASDAAFYKLCAKNKEHKCFDFRKCPLAPRVDELLRESPWWKRRNGRDHLLVVGMNYAMDHYIMKPRCKGLLRGACANCTKIAIDDYSYLHSGTNGIDEKGDSWHAVPFPSDFHWTREVVRPFPWERAVTERPLLVSYIGSTQSYYNPARRLRGSLAHFCGLHPKDCVHTSYGSSGRSVFFEEGHNPLQLSSRSVFCFQPIGDLMTRKGLFDSMLQGCIPVTFEDLTASVMYTWHWDEEFWRDVLVELPFHGVAHRYFDPVSALREMMDKNVSLVEHKQRLLRARVFELQYSLDHSSQDTFKKSADGGMEWESTWPRTERSDSEILDASAHYRMRGAPLRDAYEITMDHVLGWHSGREADFRNATVPECWNGFHDTSANGGKGLCVVEEPKK